MSAGIAHEPSQTTTPGTCTSGPFTPGVQRTGSPISGVGFFQKVAGNIAASAVLGPAIEGAHLASWVRAPEKSGRNPLFPRIAVH